MYWGFIAVALLSCYRAPATNEACTITCAGGSTSCPDGLACEGGFCVAAGQVCKPAFVQVAAGTAFACGIDDAENLWCWGSNLRHQITPGDELRHPLATRIDTTRRWEQVDAGGEHVCGIADGELYCWGRNDRGQVSDAVAGDVSGPLAIRIVDGPGRWTAVSVGKLSTCAIGDGKLWCWGANDVAQLGDGTQVDRGAPTAVSTDISDWSAVSVGDRHTCATSPTRGVHCWGASGLGQAGPNTTNPQLTPNSLGIMAATIAVSGQASCATTDSGELWCWGANARGELGESNVGLGQSQIPVRASMTTGWLAVAGSEDVFCGVRDQIVCWGSTTFGGLGDGFWSRMDAFSDVPGTVGASKISLGWNERVDELTNNDTRELTLACAIAGSDARCWGDNRFGQLAMGSATLTATPEPIAGNPVFSDLQVGLSHGCGVLNGVVSCWGSTVLGAATGVLAGHPTKACSPDLDCDVPAPKPLNFFSPAATAVALGAAHTCAFHDGVITCWGDNSAQQLITNNPAPPRERDIPGPGGATWTGIVQTGRDGQCGVYKSGMMDATACWGFVLQQRTAATPVPPLNGVKTLALGSTPAGATFDCILDVNGMLQCQGDNSFGQYGNGTTATTSALAPVMPARTYTAIATNTLSPTMCGIRTDSGVECWGLNDRGQTGAGDVTANTLTPNQLPDLSQCTAIAVGRYHACAICADNIHCWGDNRFGQLGTGTLDVQPQPMPRVTSGPPASGGAWVNLVAGYRFTCARSDQGHAICWGFDPHAALGNGARSANLPVTVRATVAR